jgi:hypothetical protein
VAGERADDTGRAPIAHDGGGGAKFIRQRREARQPGSRLSAGTPASASLAGHWQPRSAARLRQAIGAPAGS